MFISYASVLEEVLATPSCDNVTLLTKKYEDVLCIKDDIDTILILKSWAPLKASVVSIIAKLVHPDWDTRLHQTQIGGKFSLRSIDDKHIANTLFKEGLYDTATPYALTRSFEKPEPFTKDYSGNISPKAYKSSFLNIVHVINTNATSDLLKAMLVYFVLFLKVRKSENMKLKNYFFDSPIKEMGLIDVSKVLEKINKIEGCGLSVVPVITVHTLISMIQPYLWPSMTIKPLKEHTAPDGHTGSYGDVEGFDASEPLLVIEIKHNLNINDTIVDIFDKKTKELNIKLKYILTTAGISRRVDRNNISIDTVTSFIMNNLQNVLIYDASICLKFIIELRKNLTEYRNLSPENKKVLNLIICEENLNKKAYLSNKIDNVITLETPEDLPVSTSLRYIDLFSGIGGFHQSLKNVIPSSKCVMASDIDEKARITYEANHKLTPLGDIEKIDIGKIPAFELICGGFPCQAFSIAQWKDKKAFDDPRGTLFFEILKVIDVHKPKCILLENVANLRTINNGIVFQTMLNSLRSRGYKVSHELLSPHQFGIPQNRQRVYIVATMSAETFDFDPLSVQKSSCKLADILDTDVPENHYIDTEKYVIIDDIHIKKQEKSGLKFCGYIKAKLRKVGAKENTEHLSRVHKQIMRIYSTEGTHPTLAASETSGRYHIYEETTKRVRRLTLNECYKLMAFPPSFIKNKNKGIAYKQIGNSVCVKVIEEIVKEMVNQKVI